MMKCSHAYCVVRHAGQKSTWPVGSIGCYSWPFENCLGRFGAFLHCCFLLSAVWASTSQPGLLFSALTIRITVCLWGGPGAPAKLREYRREHTSVCFQTTIPSAWPWAGQLRSRTVLQTAKLPSFTPSYPSKPYQNREGLWQVARKPFPPRGLAFLDVYIS